MCLFIISLAGCLFAKPVCASVRLCLKKECVHGYVHVFVCTSMCVQLITSTRPVVTLLVHSVLSASVSTILRNQVSSATEILFNVVAS